MSIVLNDVSRFRLDNLDNYKPQLDMKSLDIIFMKYTHIICEFFDLIEKSKFKPNKGFHLYVVMKGMETIQHIFNFLLLYTCNIDLVYFHTHKAYYYYIEFMDQISKDDHYFLRFSVKDAILFVYKKTIYEIDNGLRENLIIHTETKRVLEHFNRFANTISDLMIELYNEDKIEKNTKESFLDMIERYLELETFSEKNIYKEYVRYSSHLESMFLRV